MAEATFLEKRQLAENQAKRFKIQEKLLKQKQSQRYMQLCKLMPLLRVKC